MIFGDFPVGAVGRNPPADGRGHWFDPWPGNIPRVTERLSPCATAAETRLWGLRAGTKEPVQPEAVL